MNSTIDQKSAIRQTALELFAASLLEISPKILLVDMRVNRLGFVLDLISPFPINEEILSLSLERAKAKIKGQPEIRVLEMTSKNAYEYMRHLKQQFRMESVDLGEQFTKVVQIGEYANILGGEMVLDTSLVGIIEIGGMENGGEVLYYKKKTPVIRIKGMADLSKEELKECKKKIREGKAKDHRLDKDFCIFDENGIVWLEKGLLERRNVEEKIRSLFTSQGFKEVETKGERSLFSLGEKVFEYTLFETGETSEFGLKDSPLQRVAVATISQRKRDKNSLLQLFEEWSKIFPQLEDAKVGEDFLSFVDPYGLDWNVIEVEKSEEGLEVTVWIDRLMALIMENRL